MNASSVVAALGDAAVLVTAAGADPIESVLRRLRDAASDGGDSVVLMIAPDVGAIERSMLRAVLGPLAIELAPGGRINAVDVLPGASVDNVIAAARFLAAAQSTTGQLVVIDA